MVQGPIQEFIVTKSLLQFQQRRNTPKAIKSFLLPTSQEALLGSAS